MPSPTSRRRRSDAPGRPRPLCGHRSSLGHLRQPYDAPCVVCVELVASAVVLVILAHVARGSVEDVEL